MRCLGSNYVNPQEYLQEINKNEKYDWLCSICISKMLQEGTIVKETNLKIVIHMLQQIRYTLITKANISEIIKKPRMLLDNEYTEGKEYLKEKKMKKKSW